tara:strand:+ start:274 stop:1194 length:921 start_codon:yes stop_codon:yes gene_type:complete
VLSAILLLQLKDADKNELPKSLGEPLELLLISKDTNLSILLHDSLEGILLNNIGPSPQPENSLSIVSVNHNDFTGVLKRHQNICFIYEGDEFEIKILNNLFALDQLAILIYSPSVQSLMENKNQLIQLENKIKSIERSRLFSNFSKFPNKKISKIISDRHEIDIVIPQDFFIAHSDENTTWIRRDMKNIFTGIMIINTPSLHKDSIEDALNITDSIIGRHISGTSPSSYMAIESLAPIQRKNSYINNVSCIRIQSLWTMENDFMGGIFVSYVFNNHLIYTYLYAPNKSKSNLLNQIEAIIHTIEFN